MLLTQFTHLILLPPGLQCLLGLAALGLAWRGHRAGASLVALLALVSLYLMSIPVGAAWLARPLEARVLPLGDPGQLAAAGYQAVVVLGGGRSPAAPEQQGEDLPGPETFMRLRYAARVQRAAGLPLLVSGGSPLGEGRSEAELMAESLREDFGVPVRWLESRSRTTGENAVECAALLLPQGVRRIVLVSHAVHLARARAAFARAGFSVLPAPLQFSTGLPAAGFARWTPQSGAMAASRAALHEWLGLARDAALP